MTAKVIIIAGPTAIGKSHIALELAEYLKAPIISADSRQVYKEMSIGTAKPSKHELSLADHYFINSHSIHQPLSAGEYERSARKQIDILSQDFPYIIITGGTGFYIKALLEGIDEKAPINPDLRAILDKELEQKGISSLSNRLKKLDPIKLKNLDSQNPRRLIRAIEIAAYKAKREHEPAPPHLWPYTTFSFCLTGDRPWVYDRINARVDKMMDNGLLEEVKELLPHQTLQTLDTVGYRELFAHLNGEHSLEEAVDLIKRNSRRYAKRQITWFNNQGSWQYIPAQNKDLTLQEIIEAIS